MIAVRLILAAMNFNPSNFIIFVVVVVVVVKFSLSSVVAPLTIIVFETASNKQQLWRRPDDNVGVVMLYTVLYCTVPTKKLVGNGIDF